MLDLPINFRRYYKPVNSVILLTHCLILPLHSTGFKLIDMDCPRHYEQDPVSRYLSSIHAETDVGEVVDFLIRLREDLTDKGYDCPVLTEIADRIKAYLISHNIHFNEEEIQELYEEIAKRERLIHPTSWQLQSPKEFKIELCKHKDKKKKEFKIKSKGIFGVTGQVPPPPPFFFGGGEGTDL